MHDACDTITISMSEAACLDAVRQGFDSKTRIAIEARRDLKTVATALEALNRAGLITKARGYRWHTTERATHCAVDVVPDPERRKGGKAFGRLVAGSTAERLLEVLDRPMRGADLVDYLGVSPQRVHQLAIRLHAQGLLRLGDPERVLHILARADDSSVLLTRDEERVLSVLPDDASTTIPKLAARTHMAAGRTGEALARLRENGLIEEAGTSRSRVLYRLTPEGRRHFQRGTSGGHAEPAPLKVKSDRVQHVLSYIAERGEARIRDVRDGLGIPGQSMNALMQYFKRLGLVRKVKPDLAAPYELTAEGNDTLRELMRTRDRRP